MKIKKGDKVKIITGDDKGVVAEVVAALPRSNRVIVEGVPAAETPPSCMLAAPSWSSWL